MSDYFMYHLFTIVCDIWTFRLFLLKIQTAWINTTKYWQSTGDIQNFVRCSTKLFVRWAKVATRWL